MALSLGDKLGPYEISSMVLRFWFGAPCAPLRVGERWCGNSICRNRDALQDPHWIDPPRARLETSHKTYLNSISLTSIA